MTLQELREQLQEDLMTYLDGMDARIKVDVCQIVVDNFKKLKTKTK